MGKIQGDRGRCVVGRRLFVPGQRLADDIPHYWVTNLAERQSILALPYYYHFDDQFFLMFRAHGIALEHPDVLLRNCQAELAAQYQRGRQFNMVFHPYAIAWPNRLILLEQFSREPA